jgi:protein translocase SecG subunit
MAKLGNALIVAEAVLAVLMTAGVLLQTPKSSGLGGGYRTRRGLERQIYWTTWVLVGGFLVCSIANIWMTTHLK